VCKPLARHTESLSKENIRMGAGKAAKKRRKVEEALDPTGGIND
jgi:hypothetical protein